MQQAAWDNCYPRVGLCIICNVIGLPCKYWDCLVPKCPDTSVMPKCPGSHCFVWGRGALTVGGVQVPKLGNYYCARGLGGRKNISLQCKRQFTRSGQILEFHIFDPLNAAHCTMPPGAHAPSIRPLPAATAGWSLTGQLMPTRPDRQPDPTRFHLWLPHKVTN